MSTPRINLYQGIHKGIRAMLAHLLGRAGRLSFGDAAAVSSLRAEVEDLFELLAGHARTEDRFVHPLLAPVAPSVLDRLARAHEGQEDELAHLLALLRDAAAGGPEAPAIGQRFLLGLSRFAAEQLAHMADEEELAMPAPWAACEDAALGQVQAALLASIPPAKMARYLRWMLPALNAEERAGMLTHMQGAAPPPAFAATLALCREVLAPEQWSGLPEGVRAAA